MISCCVKCCLLAHHYLNFENFGKKLNLRTSAFYHRPSPRVCMCPLLTNPLPPRVRTYFIDGPQCHFPASRRLMKSLQQQKQLIDLFTYLKNEDLLTSLLKHAISHLKSRQKANNQEHYSHLPAITCYYLLLPVALPVNVILP